MIKFIKRVLRLNKEKKIDVASITPVHDSVLFEIREDDIRELILLDDPICAKHHE